MNVLESVLSIDLFGATQFRSSLLHYKCTTACKRSIEYRIIQILIHL